MRFNRAYDASWTDDVPYVVALVELDEGPILMSNVVGPDVDQVAVDEPVEVIFELKMNDVALPQFRRRQEEQELV